MSEKTDVEVDIMDSGKKPSDNVQLPVNFITVGQVDHDDLKVYIKQDIYKHIESFSASDKTRELGGILIGNVAQVLGANHLIISDYIEAKYTDATATTLTFTHETWEYVYAEQSRRCPDKKIVGWQHTHPSYGIFLSTYDVFIERSFFDLPWQVAYVVDPVNNTRGFFQWKNQKIQKLEGFYIYDDAEKKIDIPRVLPGKEKKPSAGPGFNLFNVIISALLCVLVAGLIFSLLSGSVLSDELKLSVDSLRTVQTQNDKLNEDYNTLQSKSDDLTDRLNKLEQAAADSTVPSQNGEVVFVSYTVRNGDTMTGICSKLNVDYSANANIIKSVNGLNPDKIHAGQIILIPVAK
jgi:proteasome lid subunit RPN8/RPN11/LysM repeat protein